jgi:nuclear transport factor 2 (NTF2) superfamily protein
MAAGNEGSFCEVIGARRLALSISPLGRQPQSVADCLGLTKGEDAWNTREPEKMVLAYTADSRWRNRAEFLNGREEIVEFLERKWVPLLRQ